MAMNPNSLLHRMQIEVLEASPERLVGADAGRGQHPALRPAARRRLGGARRDARLDRRRPCTPARRGSPSASTSTPPTTARRARASSPARRPRCRLGQHPGLLRGRRHRRPGPAGSAPAGSPACCATPRPAPDATGRPARRTARRNRPGHLPHPVPVRARSSVGLPLVKSWSKRAGWGPLGRCRLTERRRHGLHLAVTLGLVPPALPRRSAAAAIVASAVDAITPVPDARARSASRRAADAARQAAAADAADTKDEPVDGSSQYDMPVARPVSDVGAERCRGRPGLRAAHRPVGAVPRDLARRPLRAPPPPSPPPPEPCTSRAGPAGAPPRRWSPRSPPGAPPRGSTRSSTRCLPSRTPRWTSSSPPSGHAWP